MAEAIGALASGIAIAGLFKGCLEAFDMIQTAKNLDTDLQKLTLRFNIEKCRLYVWGEAMGLTVPPGPGGRTALESSPFEDLVCDTLRAILAVFADTSKMKDRYGCKQIPSEPSGKDKMLKGSSSDAVKNLAASFSNFSVTERTRDKIKYTALQTRWTIHDRKKFSELIQEAKTFIDGLQEITKSLSTVARQEGKMRYGIQQVKDATTLQLVADVSKEDYPDMSDAASIKVDVLTLATHQRKAIESWADDVEEEQDGEEEDLESMTITELKHHIKMLNANQTVESRTDPEEINEGGTRDDRDTELKNRLERLENLVKSLQADENDSQRASNHSHSSNDQSQSIALDRPDSPQPRPSGSQINGGYIDSAAQTSGMQNFEQEDPEYLPPGFQADLPDWVTREQRNLSYPVVSIGTRGSERYSTPEYDTVYGFRGAKVVKRAAEEGNHSDERLSKARKQTSTDEDLARTPWERRPLGSEDHEA